MDAASDSLKIVLFKWSFTGVGFQLPSQMWGGGYTPDHVNIAARMLRRHLKMPFEVLCVTDDPTGIDDSIRCIPLWDKCRFLGGCYNRLYVFSKDMARFIGPRFACLDIDCVLTGDVTPIFSRREEFIINAYQSGDATRHIDQRYNGGLFMMDAGARSRVWDCFDIDIHPQDMEARADRIGTDQAWIREILGPDEAVFKGPEDGIYEARNIGPDLPRDARLVMFAGRRDPTTARWQWVKDHYR